MKSTKRQMFCQSQTNSGFECTLDLGHEGKHKAGVGGGEYVREWEDGAPGTLTHAEALAEYEDEPPW